MGNTLNSIIYQPPPSTYRNLGSNFRKVKSGEEEIVCYFRRFNSDNSRPAPIPSFLIFYSHGNAEDLGEVSSRLNLFGRLLETYLRTPVSFIVTAYDYCGYGLSSGKPNEAIVFKNAQDVLRQIQQEEKLINSQVIVWGRSLGSGPTCFLAHYFAQNVQTPFAGVVLESPLLSVFRVGLKSTQKLSLPFDQFKNYERLVQGFGESTKIFIIHGKEDQVVPFSHGKTMFDNIPPQNRFEPLFVDKAGHNDVDYVLMKENNNQAGVAHYVANFVLNVFERHE